MLAFIWTGKLPQCSKEKAKVHSSHSRQPNLMSVTHRVRAINQLLRCDIWRHPCRSVGILQHASRSVQLQTQHSVVVQLALAVTAGRVRHTSPSERRLRIASIQAKRCSI